MFDGDEHIGLAFIGRDGLRHVGSPHFVDAIGDDHPTIHRYAQGMESEPDSFPQPPAGQRAFVLQGVDFGVEKLILHGDLADLGFQPCDLVVAVIPLAASRAAAPARR